MVVAPPASPARALSALLALGPAVFAQGVRQPSGTVAFLRVHDVGTGFGGPGSRPDDGVVIRLSSGDGFYGSLLRVDEDRLTHQGMLDLLLLAYENECFRVMPAPRDPPQ